MILFHSCVEFSQVFQTKEQIKAAIGEKRKVSVLIPAG